MSDGIFDTDWRDAMNAALEKGKREIAELKAAIERGGGIVRDYQRALEESHAENAKLRNEIKHAAAYFESCGYGALAVDEPEFQMLRSFKKALGIE